MVDGPLMNRRKFLKSALIAGAGVSVPLAISAQNELPKGYITRRQFEWMRDYLHRSGRRLDDRPLLTVNYTLLAPGLSRQEFRDMSLPMYREVNGHTDVVLKTAEGEVVWSGDFSEIPLTDLMYTEYLQEPVTTGFYPKFLMVQRYAIRWV